MKKSSLKTFLAGKNPYFRESARLNGAKPIDDLTVVARPYDVPTNDVCQHVSGFDRDWYCDVLDDGTAITYYPGE